MSGVDAGRLLIYDVDPLVGRWLIEYNRDGRNSSMGYTFTHYWMMDGVFWEDKG